MNPKTTNAPGDGPPDPNTLKRLTKQIDEAFEEVAKLSGLNHPPTTFYQEFLQRVLAGIEAPAGAVWIRTPQGFLQLQCQLNLDKVGLDKHRLGRQAHNELLRQTFQSSKPAMLEPMARLGGMGEAGPPAANLTEYLCLLAPILVDDQKAVGLLEIWQEPAWDPRVHPTHLNYTVQMAGYASNYVRNTQNRQAQNEYAVWTQVESFARQIHSSLNPSETAFQIANEGRRLIGCDRLSVAIRYHRKAVVEAVSGSDVVERASNQVVLMRKLFDTVLAWDEKLVFKGEKDETLPPDVYEALDAYLEESNAKLLVLQPIRDEREKDPKKPKKLARSALLMECFEPPEQTEPLIQRLEIVGNHAAPALYNAAEHKRIPFRFLWLPLAKIQDGLGGKTRAIVYSILAVLALLVTAMIMVPYPLRLEAKGQLVPVERTWVYSPREGQIRNFKIEQGSVVRPDDELVEMFDPQLQSEIDDINKRIAQADTQIRYLRSRLSPPPTDPVMKGQIEGELAQETAKKFALDKRLKEIERIFNCDRQKPGYFTIRAPKFSPTKTQLASARWTILSADFREQLQNRTVRPSDPILRLGNKEDRWEIELKIPQKHIGQVLKAFPNQGADPESVLEVDLLVSSVPTHTYKGLLYRKHVAREAVPNRDDHNESEPIVFAYVQINDPRIPEEYHIPKGLLVTGVEIHAKIRCGDHPLGYSLFYGVWEFFYEKVIFAF